MSLCYFDSAATSWPKPKSVIKAVENSFYASGGNPGRSYHPLSLGAARAVYSCRETLCSLFGTDKPENVVFFYNTTHALNAAIKGLAPKSGRIIFSNLEHNSVIRPVYALCNDQNLDLEYDVFNALGDDKDVLSDFEMRLTDDTKLAVVTMASNVCGKILPIRQIGEICRKRGIKFIVDCAQTGGCVPFEFDGLCADAACFAGHKSLYGPQGCGFCIFADGLSPESVIQGGNGVNSASFMMEGPLPERLEAGTVGTPAICGLKAGAEYVMRVGVENIFRQGNVLSEKLCDGLRNISGVTVYGQSKNSTPCVLFNKQGIKSERIAMLLAQNGICVRSGLHCAPLAHKAFGTLQNGAVRVSLSHMNKPNEIDRLLKIVNLAGQDV